MNSQTLSQLTSCSNGMMPAEVYEEIAAIAALATGDQFVEVGTAHGAATIALAYGAKESGRKVTIHTIDRLAGQFSSRSKFGSVSDNEQIVRKNFERAGVSNSIHMFIGDANDFAKSAQCPKEIGLLMLDADGRIDRDLINFYERIPIGAPIIIDDVDDSVLISTNHLNRHYLDLKHKITSLLLHKYEEAGFLKINNVLFGTAFCERGERGADATSMFQIALECYRQLVFIDITDYPLNEVVSLAKDMDRIRYSLDLQANLPHRMQASILRFSKFARRVLGR
jgi:predicted O-methyltransferase YrrM